MIIFAIVGYIVTALLLLTLGTPWHSLLIGAVIAFLIGWFLG